MEKKMGYVSPVAIHPGEVIKETIEMLEMSQADLSTRTDLSEKTVSLIINGKEPVTVSTALKLERVLDLDQRMLVGMQARYWADKSRIDESARLGKEKKYLKNYPFYKDLAHIGYVVKSLDPIKKIEELLRFFNVNSLKSVPNIMEVSFRRADTGTIDNYALASWLRIGEIESKKLDIKPFDKDILKKNVEKMRSLTKENPNIFANQLIELCAEAGVKLVFTPHLPKTKVNGATYWVSKNNPLIQISLFNSYADIFWFTFFHEIGHILKHGKKKFIDFNNGYSKDSQEEKEADQFAQRILIKDEKLYQDFKKDLTTSNVKDKILEFAGKVDIDPGIVAGRVGKDFNAWRLVSKLRKRLIFGE